MPHMIRMLPLLAMLLWWSTACKKHTVDDLPTTQLHFGSGGGFAGAYTEYLILENGQCFKKESLNDSYKSIGKAKKSATKALFSQWETAKLGAMDFKHPGNLYYFVAMEVEGQIHRLSWGASGHSAADQLKAFYKACNALIPQEKSTSN